MQSKVITLESIFIDIESHESWACIQYIYLQFAIIVYKTYKDWPYLYVGL